MLGFLFATAVTAVLYALTAFYPPQSEDWIHLEIICQQESWLSAFDLPVSHSRPVWFLALWSMMPAGFDHPELVRIATFGLHVVIVFLVGVLARTLGASKAQSQLAMVVFACFPSVKGLAWLLAISTPLHVLAMLLALILAVHHSRRPRAATGICLVLVQVIAVGCHSAAAFLPFCIGVMAMATSPRGWRGVFDRWLIATIVVGLGLVLLLAWLPTTDRYHSLRSIAAIAANTSRAMLSLLPELIRGPAIDGLRGVAGTAGFVFGIGACGVVAGAFAMVLWRADKAVKALLLIAVIDLVPPALTAGFVIRYAYFPAAMVSIALLLHARATKRWIVPIALLAIGWVYDTGVDVGEIREGGRLGIAAVESARKVREAAGDGAKVWLINAPGEVGPERDVMVFNWGLRIALRRNGVAGPWQLLRTQDYMHNSDIQRVDEAHVKRVADRGVEVWSWNAEREEYVRYAAN